MKLENRVFLRVIGLPFYRRLVIPLSALLLVVTLADANTNWTALRDQLAASSPWEVTILFTVLVTVWGLAAGAALRPVWRQPAIAFLVRQPLTRWQWVRYLLPPLSIAFLPALGIWWLAPHYANTPIHYAGFLGLVWTIMLGGSFRGLIAAKWIAMGITTVASLIWAYAYQPNVAYLALIVSVALLPFSVSGIRHQIVRSDQASRGSLISISPIIAIVRRDLQCLWGRERKTLFSVLQLAIVTVLFMVALRINGGVVGREAFVFSCGLLSLALLPTYDILTRLKVRLGPEFMRRRWPINHRQRAAAILALIVVLMGPSVIALCIAGSTMGVSYLAEFIFYAATTLIVLLALFSQTLLTPVVSFGWSLWILLIHPIFVMTVPSWVYMVVAAAVSLVGGRLIIGGLREFTQQSEIRIRE